MLEPHQLHDYQQKAVNFQCSRWNSALWLDMGLGKTVVTLTSINHLLQSSQLNAVLIVAPIRVIRMVWRQEAVKWSHTKDLEFSMVAGTKDQRVRALMRKANVYLINYENLRWLADTLNGYYIKKNKPLPFDGIVWDEISKMKNSTTQRVKAVRKMLPHIKWTTGLTGTPASNGYKDLHGQYLVLDKGERLGTSKTAFRSRFYKKEGPFKEVPYDDTESTIKRLIGDITLEMSAEDYNPLPDLVVNDVDIEMPKNLREKYESLEKQFFFQLDNEKEVEVFNQAALTNKCLQFANGSVYPISGAPMWEPIHHLKLDALEDIIEEAQGQPVLCSYSYRSDAERIMEHFKDIDPINLTDCKSEKSLNHAMTSWKNGTCRLMIGHPACLHADTLVLTERDGWTRIVDVRFDDRVFDGIEFVSHSGCMYAGYKDTINVYGVTMTPDHKVWVNDEWVEGQNVDTSEKGKRKAEFLWETENDGSSDMRSLRKEYDSKEHQEEKRSKNHVYDLVDCGPRHRFLVKNKVGEMFIVKNSMGHGVDGLQKNGHILVWFGLNWSLDLYEQFNARIRRQGQGVPVICHRLLIQDTLDHAQSLALDEKAQTQSELRNAIKEYRKSKQH